MDKDIEEYLSQYDLSSPEEKIRKKIGGNEGDESELGTFGTMRKYGGDILAAPFRGVVAAADSAFDLAESAFGLKDYNLRFLGKSKTGLGQVGESLSQFLTGFVPVVGWAGRAAKLGKLAKGVSGIKGAKNLKQAEKALRASGKKTKAYLMSSGRYAVGGAAADFMLFPAHEARLSNFITSVGENYPSLQNPLTDYLAADPKDSELEGRFKNAVEGMGIGVLFDALVMAKRAYSAGAKSRLAGKSEAETEKAIAKAVTPEELDAVLTKLDDAIAASDVAASGTRKVDETTGELLPLEAAEDILKAGAKKPARKNISGKEYTKIDAERAKAALKTIDGIDDISNSEDLFGFAKALMDNDKAVEEIRGRVMTDAERDVRAGDAIQEVVDMTGKDAPSALLARLKEDVVSGSGMNVKIRAHRAFLYASAKSLYSKAQRVLGTKEPASALDYLNFQKAEMQHHMIQKLVRELMRQSGLNLRTWHKRHAYDLGLDLQNLKAKNTDKDGVLDFRALDAMIESGSMSREQMRASAEKIRAMVNAGGVENLASKELGSTLAKAKSIWLLPNEVWINGLLGLKTFTVTTIGNSLATLYKPMEIAAGRAIDGQGVGTAITDMARTYKYLVQMTFDTLKLTKLADQVEKPSVLKLATKAFVESNSQIGRTLGEEYSHQKHFTSGAFNIESNTVAKAVDFIGETIRLPMRFLIGSDEFFKQINARAHGLVKLDDMARNLKKEGKITNSDEWVSTQFNGLIDQSGKLYSKDRAAYNAAQAAISKGLTGHDAHDFITKQLKNYDPSLSKVADFSKEVAEELTFSRAPENLAKKYGQKILNECPLIRQMIPFYVSPLNLINFFTRRMEFITPMLGSTKMGEFLHLKSVNKKYWEHLNSPDPFVRSQANGRLAMGALMMTAALEAARRGLITGNGPENRGEKKLWEAAGNQSYSFRVGDKWVAFNRVDPFASFLGIAADIQYRLRNPEGIGEGDMEALMWGAIAGFSRNITKKTYLKSIDDMITFLQDPQPSKWAKGRVASFIPALVGQMPGSFGDDPYMREAREWTDYLMKRIPGMSDNLDVQRNILGEPIERKMLTPDWSAAYGFVNYINPIFITDVKNDRVMEELTKLRKGWDVPNPIMAGGELNMTKYRNSEGQSAYDRYQEILSEAQLKGLSLRNTLDRLIRSNGYRSIPELGKELTESESPRIREINKVLRKFKAEAMRRVKLEFPEFGHDYDKWYSFQDSLAMPTDTAWGEHDVSRDTGGTTVQDILGSLSATGQSYR